MLNVVTPEEMAELDRLAMEEGAVPGIVLMENAAFGVTQVILENFKDCPGPVIILAGIGNNGGDGFCIARQLAMQGAAPLVYLVGKEEKLKGDALTNYQILQKRDDIDLNILDEKENLKSDLEKSGVIVDALLGTGIKGEVREPIASVIKSINEEKETRKKPVISVDIPSGVMGGRGEVQGEAVKAVKTVTFALPKFGHFLYPGKEHTGQLYLAHIGISDKIVNGYFSYGSAPAVKYVEKEDIASFIPERRGNAHKGDFGRILILAGSRGMLGACYLASQGALRSGGGLVTAAVPESEQRSLQTKLTEAMTVPLPSEDGIFTEKATKKATEIFPEYNSLAIGPGIRNTSSTYELVKRAAGGFQGPVVIDADGLNVLSRDIELLEGIFPNRDVPAVLTPHLGELERLCKKSKSEILEDPIKIINDLAEKWGVYIVLKGSPTYIAAPGREVYIVDTGNPGMATGGTGDVLTGVLSSCLAQAGSPVQKDKFLKAILLGVYLHGFSGDLAVQDLGMEGLVAGDLCFYLPEGIKELKKLAKKLNETERSAINCGPKIL